MNPLTRTLLLCMAVLTGLTAQTSNPMQIQNKYTAISAARVQITLATDLGNSTVLGNILAGDSTAIGPLVPYGVLVTNQSAKNLRAIGVTFQWSNPNPVVGPPQFTTFQVLTAFQPNDPSRTPPGGSMLFTPVQSVNQYLAVPASQRGAFLGRAQISTSAGVIQQPPANIAALVASTLSQLPAPQSISVNIEGVVFDDWSFVGGNALFTKLQEVQPLIHQ